MGLPKDGKICYIHCFSATFIFRLIMNTAIQAALEHAVQSLQAEGVLPSDFNNSGNLTRTKDRSHGDFASNIAMIGSKAAGMKPRDLAEKILAHLPEVADISKAEIAGPGFINFFLNADQRFAVLDLVQAQQDQFGRTSANAAKRVQVEFVSANPTSSLHVGHGRGAAYGMTVANLLEATGATVDREYYVNDAGRQMDILATSTYLRYLELTGQELVFPKNAYQGDYVKEIAQSIIDQDADAYVRPVAEVYQDVPEDVQYAAEPDSDGNKVVLSGDKEKHIDGLIYNSQRLIGEGYRVFHQAALKAILDDIKDDLGEFGVTFNQWFSEASLTEKIDEALQMLDQRGFLYEQDGNIWFKSTEFGDEKDRVVKRRNGQTTYFASDIAYHLNKLQRGYTDIVDIWGSDHHGYIARVKAAIDALGYDSKKLTVLLVQFVSLWRSGVMVQMSSRSGQFVTLRDLRKEVGNDAARFYYVMRKSEQHIDFDLDLAVSQSKDNAVYYIQYAHARICRMLEKAAATDVNFDAVNARQFAAKLDLDAETEILAKLAAYPEIVIRAANSYEPHQVGNYLKELAALFHGWYNEHKVLNDDAELTQARLLLSVNVQQVLRNGLELLGVSAPESM
ncbi:arginyl-tRNA synthetase [Acinetobacter bohemicus ANC 3994]|uniref:Arginine--tRNA ligase n=2 Tax=Acinetobacter bohemicus TaxID=1435036 RepID=N8QII9_9GAMM|nr:arginyl-tRNA synthetase [Acinetobacter bohemicus ANC 3994]